MPFEHPTGLSQGITFGPLGLGPFAGVTGTTGSTDAMTTPAIAAAEMITVANEVNFITVDDVF